MPKNGATPLMNQVANLDVALDGFREWLPTHGFKLVLPPPTAGGAPYAFASAWRRGDAQVVSHKGTTAALALLRAGESELVRLHDACAVAACTRCHGLCWFVTNAGMVELCHHPESKKFPVG
jgi:hypothetical protein